MSNARRDDEQPGDPAVDQAWRSAATDEPSARLDATILAAAQAATARARPAPTPPAARHLWTHWPPLAAAAGVAGLAFTIVQMLPREADVPATPSTGHAIERALPGRSESLPQQNATPSPSSPPMADTEARDVAGATAEVDASSEQRLRQIAPPAATPTTPEDWARRIETLYVAGDESAAVDALLAFRAVHPGADQYLAESLRPWAASVDEGRARAKEPAGITP